MDSRQRGIFGFRYSPTLHLSSILALQASPHGLGCSPAFPANASPCIKRNLRVKSSRIFSLVADVFLTKPMPINATGGAAGIKQMFSISMRSFSEISRVKRLVVYKKGHHCGYQIHYYLSLTVKHRKALLIGKLVESI